MSKLKAIGLNQIGIQFGANSVTCQEAQVAERRKSTAHDESRGRQAPFEEAPKGRKSTPPKLMMLVMLLSALLLAQGQSSPNEQLPAGPAKEKAEAACLTCHEARIMVQQRLTKAAWVKEMDKMTKSGAEVDPKDRDALIDYFSANFTPDQSAYEAPRSANETKSKTKAKH